MKLCFQKAQSTVEYLVLFAGVVVVLIAFLNPNGPFRNTVERITYNTVGWTNDIISELNYMNTW